MAINWKSPNDWRSRNAGVMTDYNGMVFSLAWEKDGIWKTYFRTFHLQKVRKVLIGQYVTDLHFDEELTNNNFIMIYAVSKDTNYETIKENFEKKNLEFLIFKEIFNINQEDIRFYLPNLQIKIDWHGKLYGSLNKRNTLQIKIYKKITSSLNDKENKLRITLPKFNFPLNQYHEIHMMKN